MFTGVFAFSVMVKQFKNTGFLEPEDGDIAALRTAGNYLPVIIAFLPDIPEPRA
jgi:hypothetical protein